MRADGWCGETPQRKGSSTNLVSKSTTEGVMGETTLMVLLHKDRSESQIIVNVDSDEATYIVVTLALEGVE